MTQEQTEKVMGAEERSEETRRFVRSVRRATRRRYTPEEKIRIGIPQSSANFAGTRSSSKGSAARRRSTTCAGAKASSRRTTTRGS